MDPFTKYKTASVSTSSVIRQLIFVFDEIIKLLHIAGKAIEEKDFETKFKALTNVVETFYLLRAGIGQEKNGDLLELLDNFYKIIIAKAEKINIDGNDPLKIDEITNSILIVRDSIKVTVENEG